MRRVHTAVVLAGALALCSCAGGARGRHPDRAPTPPSPGSAYGPTLASLDVGPDPDTDVELRTLRVMAVADGRFAPLDPAAAEGRPGRIAVTAYRRCSVREGWRRRRVERASWYVFDDGRLTAFDHTDFATGCATRRRFRPSPPGDLETERTLARWVGQRYPASRTDAADRLRRGIALAEVGRLEEAQEALEGGDRAVEDLRRQRGTVPVDAPEEQDALQARLDEVRALRATLYRTLRAAREAAAADASAQPETTAPR